MSPATRSVLLAVIFGMMAASVLHENDIIDLSYGFPRGGILEGGLMALTGAVGGYAMLFVFRLFRRLSRNAGKE